jgi:hypothetical protein
MLFFLSALYNIRRLVRYPVIGRTGTSLFGFAGVFLAGGTQKSPELRTVINLRITWRVNTPSDC